MNAKYKRPQYHVTNTSKTFIQKIQYKKNHEHSIVTRNL